MELHLLCFGVPSPNLRVVWAGPLGILQQLPGEISGEILLALPSMPRFGQVGHIPGARGPCISENVLGPRRRDIIADKEVC